MDMYGEFTAPCTSEAVVISGISQTLRVRVFVSKPKSFAAVTVSFVVVLDFGVPLMRPEVLISRPSGRLPLIVQTNGGVPDAESW